MWSKATIEEHRRRVLWHGLRFGWPHYSLTGYLPDSADRFRPFNVIPADTLTMHTVPHDILAVADTGQVQWMKADTGIYRFPNAVWVHETPIHAFTGAHTRTRKSHRKTLSG